MPEFLGPIALNDAYTPSIQIGPAKGVKQFSLSLFAQASDPKNSYPALVQFWRYPFDPRTGLFNVDGDPTLETGERFFAGNTQGALYTGVAGARFRNYIAGKKAVCLAEIDFRDDPIGTGGSVSSAVVTTGGTSGGGGGVTFLGRFTPAQWPPATAANGDVAAYADLGVEWLMEYQSATNNWRIYNADTAPVAVVAFANTLVSTNFGSTILGVGGNWTIGAYFTESVSGASASGRVGTTAGGTDIIAAAPLTPAVGRFDATASVTYTAARGAPVFPSTSQSGGCVSPYYVVTFAPVTLLNA